MSSFRYRIKIEFKDILAVMFVTFFFYVTISSFLGNGEYELVKTLVQPVSIILGGYFGQGMVRSWRNKETEDYGKKV